MINREASDSQKGFRLQKVRAISVILDLIEKHDNPHVYSATEYYEDVYIKDSTIGSEREVFEENKNYDPNSVFTINSHEVKNSIVSFIDIWIEKGHAISKKIFFNFYATNSIGKERQTALIKSEKFKLPEKPILEYLVAGDLDDELLGIIMVIIISEYKEQYQKRDGEGHEALIECWTIDDWKKFFSKINWLFGQSDENELKEEVIEKIKVCKHFSIQHCDGFENQIFETLMEKFDSRYNITDPLDRFIYGAEVEVVFKDIRISALSETKTRLKNDEVWKMWNALPEPDDKRNLPEKVLEVCPLFSPRAIARLAVKVTRNYVETENIKADKNFLSYRYRVYEDCQDTLDSILDEVEDGYVITEKDIKLWIDKLKTSAKNTMQDLSVDYKYNHNNQVLLEGVILELFDTCFLSFDYAA